MNNQPDHDTRVPSRTLNKSQRRALRRILRFYRDRNSYTGCTSVRFKITRPYSAPSIVITTRRSDCSKYSPRAVVSDERAHFMLGPRGGIKLYSSNSGLRTDTTHVRKMLGAK